MLVTGGGEAALTAPASDALITLIRIYLGSASPAEMPAELDEEALYEEARLSGLIPLLYLHPCKSLFSDAFRERLKSAYIVHTAHFSRLAKSLLTICARFQNDGIAAAPFKGIGLSQRLFGDFHFRLHTDHDILVKKDQVHEAAAALQSCGFQLAQSLPNQPDWIALAEQVYSLEFLHPAQKVLVDLQWDVANGYISPPLPEDELFRNLSHISILDQSVPFFKDAVVLLLLCVHGAKNGWCELRALLDLAMTMQKMEEAVWRETIALMQRRGILTMLTTGIVLAQQILGTAIPAPAAEQITPRARKLADAVQRHWQDKGRARPSAWRRFIWDLRFREGWREKSRYLLFRMRPTKTDLLNRSESRSFAALRRLERILKSAAGLDRTRP